MIDRDWLGSWIQSHHLSSPALDKYRLEYAGSSCRAIQIRDFLVPDLVSRVQKYLHQEASWENSYGLYQTNMRHNVSESEWKEAEEENKFWKYSALYDFNGTRNFSSNLIGFLKLRAYFQDTRFVEFVQHLTNTSLSRISLFRPHRMLPGDYLKPHSDRAEDRRIAVNLYLTPGWHPSCGGRLYMTSIPGLQDVFDAEYNSLTLFDIYENAEHYVSEITNEMTGLQRISISLFIDASQQ